MNIHMPRSAQQCRDIGHQRSEMEWAEASLVDVAFGQTGSVPPAVASHDPPLTSLSFNLQPLNLLNHGFPSQLSRTWFSLALSMFCTNIASMAFIGSIFIAYHCSHSLFVDKAG
jgi:hypothetical protein